MHILLIGLLISTDSSKSLAAFHLDGKLEIKKLGQRVGEYQLSYIGKRHDLFLEKENHFYRIRPGDSLDEAEPGRDPYQFIERKENQVIISEQLRDFIGGQNLPSILMQASSIPVIGEGGALVGFKIGDFEPNSIFELGGFVEGDVITSIGGITLDNAATAVKALMAVRNESDFEVRLIRDGSERTLRILVK